MRGASCFFLDSNGQSSSRFVNRHLAFATGVHQCAGMVLAWLEDAIAISRLLGRFPAYRLGGTPVRGGRVRFRGFFARAVRGRLE
jgi:cytochrome P450